MFALCLESSHLRGMGHLFRMLRFAQFLREQEQACVFFLNEHQQAFRILEQSGFDYAVAPLQDIESCWEANLISRYGIDVWVDDRLDTAREHALHVRDAGARLVSFDDRGEGAELADINVAALVFDHVGRLRGGKVLSGPKYLVLDPQIDAYRRVRSGLGKVVVSMGGSDTYGVTLQIVEALRYSQVPVAIIVGPGFEHMQALRQILPESFELKVNVPSLVEAFYEFDLAFTAGGVTPFEAAASGLPCVVVATEDFEVSVGRYLESTGSCVFAGHYQQMREINLPALAEHIHKMSHLGLESFDTQGAERIYREIRQL